MKMSTRRAMAEDAAWIAALCYKQFQEAHRKALKPDDLLYAVDSMFLPDAVAADIKEKDHHYFAVTDGTGKPLGCVKLGPPELDLAKEVKGAIELTRLYLNPAMIGKNVAALLLKTCVDFVKAHQQYNSIWLHVYEGNLRARRFYEKAGFTMEGNQLYPICNSVPTGIVMKLEVV
jgi:GNAT superfamily N-acetyltransferase